VNSEGRKSVVKSKRLPHSDHPAISAEHNLLVPNSDVYVTQECGVKDYAISISLGVK